MQAYRALQKGETLVSPRAWLATVVKRQTLNRRRDRHETPIAEPVAEHEDGAAGRADVVDQHANLRAVLYTLPEAQHHAFVLRHWTGLSHAEIARVLGTSVSAVESLLVRARTAILAADRVGDGCVEIRDRIAAGVQLTPPQTSHLAGCQGCRSAERRLTRVAAAAVVLGLAPRVHVAQALAAAAPGFAGTAGGAAGGVTAAGSKAGAAAVVAKTGSGVAVIATAVLIGHAHFVHPGRLFGHAGRVAAIPALHQAAVGTHPVLNSNHGAGAGTSVAAPAPDIDHARTTSHRTHDGQSVGDGAPGQTGPSGGQGGSPGASAASDSQGQGGDGQGDQSQRSGDGSNGGSSSSSGDSGSTSSSQGEQTDTQDQQSGDQGPSPAGGTAGDQGSSGDNSGNQ
jgi:RNA polymerase sigma factor (sigma-70 family)